MLEFKTKDHPEANGKKPIIGQQEWTLSFPLEDGERLIVKIGRRGRDALLSMLQREDRDDEEGVPSTSSIVGVKEALKFALGGVHWYNVDKEGYLRCLYCQSVGSATQEVTHTSDCYYHNALLVLEQLERS